MTIQHLPLLAYNNPNLFQLNILLRVTARLPTWLNKPDVLTSVLYRVLSRSSTEFDTHVTCGRFLCAVICADAMVTTNTTKHINVCVLHIWQECCFYTSLMLSYCQKSTCHQLPF